MSGPDPSFADHFSSVAARYRRHRPHYPPELFAWLASLVERHELAWDCATGNGQAALGLTPHFERVLATDASADQIAHACPHPQVEYRVGPAHGSGLPDRSVDLVTVAQALHWFDLDLFWPEVQRVLAPSAVVAVWAYGRGRIDDVAADRMLARFYEVTVGPYWPPERAQVEAGYRDRPFPFAEIRAERFAMVAQYCLDDLSGYLGTWSAVNRAIAARGGDPVGDLARELATVWGDPARPREIRWPLALRVGRLIGDERG